MKETIKKIAVWGGMIGVSGGVVVTILAFALDAYVGRVVDDKIAAHTLDHPITTTINGELNIIKDGIDDNTGRLIELQQSQENFELLFMEYLQREANR
jgi:hypothetical protein